MDSTAIDICSDALIAIECDPISSFGDDSEEARVCKQQFPRVLRRCLSTARWSFARSTAKLSRLTAEPLFEFRFAFQLPSDFLKFDSKNCMYSEYKRVGNTIYSNEEVMNILYIREPKTFPPLFAHYVAYELAISICPKITGDRDAIRQLKALSEDAKADATLHNSNESSPDTPDSSVFSGFYQL